MGNNPKIYCERAGGFVEIVNPDALTQYVRTAWYDYDETAPRFVKPCCRESGIYVFWFDEGFYPLAVAVAGEHCADACEGFLEWADDNRSCHILDQNDLIDYADDETQADIAALKKANATAEQIAERYANATDHGPIAYSPSGNPYRGESINGIECPVTFVALDLED